MEQDDEEFEQLLGEIPRATSAPPHLEELQRAYGTELNNSPFVVSVGEGGHAVKPFIDIRCDEQYENFYRAYSGVKKLPPPMENRPLYAAAGDFSSAAGSPESAANSASTITHLFSSLAIDSPRTMAGLRPHPHSHSHPRPHPHPHPEQQQHQEPLQISASINNSASNNGSINNSGRTPSPPSSDHNHHRHHRHGNSGNGSAAAADDRTSSLPSAFGNLNFEESGAGSSTNGLSTGNGVGTGGGRHDEAGVGVVVVDANEVLDHGVMVGGGISLPNGRGVGVAGGAGLPGMYSHLLPFSSSGFGSEPGSVLVDPFDVNNHRSPSTMELFSSSQKNAGGPGGAAGGAAAESGPIIVGNGSSSNSSSYGGGSHSGSGSGGGGSGGGLEFGRFDGQSAQAQQALEKYLRRASPPGGLDGNHVYASSSSNSGRQNNGMGMMDGFGSSATTNNSNSKHNAAAAAAAAHAHHHQQQEQQQQMEAYAAAAALATARGLHHPEIASNSVNGSDLYVNHHHHHQAGLDYNAASARVLQQQAQQLQIQLEAEQRRQYQQHMRFYASLQAAHANGGLGVGGAIGGVGGPATANGSISSFPSSRGHSPTESSSSSARPLHYHQQGAAAGTHNLKSSRNSNHDHHQFWNDAGHQSNAIDAHRISSAAAVPGGSSSICRFYAQGYCSRGEACPFIHSSIEGFGGGGAGGGGASGRVLTGSNFKEPSGRGEQRLFADKMLSSSSRPRASSSRAAAAAATNGGHNNHNHHHNHHHRRKHEGVANGGSHTPPQFAMNGQAHAYANAGANGNHHHHPAPVILHGDAQMYSGMLEDTLDYESSWQAMVLGAQHMSPHNQQNQQQQGQGQAQGQQQQQQPKYNTLEEVEGRIFSIAKDQHGCRFLQRKFDEGGPEDVQKIFNEIIDHIIELMTDPFGNYLVQKLLEVCDENQRMEILHVVTGKGELITISLNMHGTRAVQKLIETLKSSEQIAMVIAALKPGVVTLIKDLNGNHVIQRCLQKLSQEDSQFIFDAAAMHCVEIATHRHGCCVLQRCVDHARGTRQERLVAEIAKNALILSQDPFGNYVVQYILEMDLPWAPAEVMIRLENNFPYLAMQKFSSNVVEKCLKVANEEYRGRIVRELINSPRLGQVLQDPYANYVVQCALAVSKGPLHMGFVDAIRPHAATLRSSPFGKRILARTNIKK